MSNQLRQINDIQAQAERICSNKVSLEEIENFGKYSNELKNYLLNNVNDEFTLTLVNEIPDLQKELEKKSTKSNFIDGILALVGGPIGLFSRESRKVDSVKGVVREIQGKFSSIAFVLKNAED